MYACYATQTSLVQTPWQHTLMRPRLTRRQRRLFLLSRTLGCQHTYPRVPRYLPLGTLHRVGTQTMAYFYFFSFFKFWLTAQWRVVPGGGVPVSKRQHCSPDKASSHRPKAEDHVARHCSPVGNFFGHLDGVRSSADLYVFFLLILKGLALSFWNSLVSRLQDV